MVPPESPLIGRENRESCVAPCMGQDVPNDNLVPVRRRRLASAILDPREATTKPKTQPPAPVTLSPAAGAFRWLPLRRAERIGLLSDQSPDEHLNHEIADSLLRTRLTKLRPNTIQYIFAPVYPVCCRLNALGGQSAKSGWTIADPSCRFSSDRESRALRVFADGGTDAGYYCSMSSPLL